MTATRTASPIRSAASAGAVSGRKSHWAILLLAVLVLILAGTLRIQGGEQVLLGRLGPLPELCALKRVTGLDCPGCGLTRCFISMGRGQVQRAWEYNPAGIALFVVVAAQIPYRALLLCRHGPRPLGSRYPELGMWGLLVFTVLMVLQWLARLVW